jgi:hypothetical protein
VRPARRKTATLLRSGCEADTSSPIGNCKAPIRLQAGTLLFSINPLLAFPFVNGPHCRGLA